MGKTPRPEPTPHLAKIGDDGTLGARRDMVFISIFVLIAITVVAILLLAK